MVGKQVKQDWGELVIVKLLEDVWEVCYILVSTLSPP